MKFTSVFGFVLRLLVVTSLVGVTASFAAAQKPKNKSSSTTGFVESEYRLNAGDVIRIEVFGESDLNVSKKISDNGTIDYPFLGEVKSRGKTTSELGAELEKQLGGSYLRDPKVTVAISEYRPFFVNGQVRNPGSFPFQPGMTVRKAISLAGGMTERASIRNINLIPESSQGKNKPNKVTLDAELGPGDIITIEESFF